MSKLTSLQISIIGAVTAIIFSLVMYFALINPRKNDANDQNASAESARQAGGTQDKIDSNTRERTRQKHQTEKIDDDWKTESAVYMPPIHDQDPNLIADYEHFVKDMPTEWGEWVKSWYDAQRPKGIDRLSEFPIEPLVRTPNDIANLTSITFPVGGKPWLVELDARGFNNVIQHLKSINKTMIHHGMPVINNVKLSGQSPHLLVTYDLSLYVIPPVPPAHADGMIGNDAGSSGGGGARGGAGARGGGGAPAMGAPRPAAGPSGGGGAAGGSGTAKAAMKPAGA